VRQNTSAFVIAHRTLLREGIASLLQHSEYKVVACAAHPAELKDVHGSAGRPKLVLFGLENGDYEKTSASIQSLRATYSGCKIIIIAETSVPIDLQRILALAPDGFILNVSSREIFLRSLDLTLLEQQVLVLGRATASSPSPEFPGGHPTREVPSADHRFEKDRSSALDTNDPALSEREREVLTCVAQGYPNKAIARHCNITESTVKVHLKAILRKIDAQNRTQAAIWAVHHGYRRVSGKDGRECEAAMTFSRSLDRPALPEASPATILNAMLKRLDS
jgi:two-component system, NarL family, nitrate/nitrite response regulator NarL